MKAHVRHPLADLLGNDPRWPDPEESVGDFIKLIDGKKSCWKAKGRAREVFEILAEDIKTYLDKCVDSIPGSDWVTWSIYLIGKAPQRAAPVVMFFCEEPRPRRKVQEVIRKSGILERYPGIKSGNAALPPDLDQLEPLASDAVSNEDTAKTEGSNLNFTISVSRNKVFVTGYHGNTSSTRIATLGGIVEHNGDTYVFTAGHPLDKTSPSSPLREPKIIDEEWEIDSDIDMEVDIYDEEFMEAMSRASNTPVDARSETSSCSDDGSSDTQSTRSLQFEDAPTSVEDRFLDQSSQTQAASCRVVKYWASEDIIPTMDTHKFGRNASAVPASAATEGHLVVLSADLDYALIKVKDSSLLTVKDSADNTSAANPLRPTHVITTGPRDTEIITYTASGGLMTGTLYGTPSYTRLPNSKTFQEVYTVRFNGCLAKGDCGSWVIDAETRGLYGHIIAGCERTGTAYIMSAHNVFEDAKEHLGGELLLECDPASEAISPTDLAEIAEAVLAKEFAIPDLHSPTFNDVTPQNVDSTVKYGTQSQPSTGRWIPDNPNSLLYGAHDIYSSGETPDSPNSLMARFLAERSGTVEPFGTERHDRTPIAYSHSPGVEMHPLVYDIPECPKPSFPVYSSFGNPQGDHEQFSAKAEEGNLVGFDETSLAVTRCSESFIEQSPSHLRKRSNSIAIPMTLRTAHRQKYDRPVDNSYSCRECSKEFKRPCDHGLVKSTLSVQEIFEVLTIEEILQLYRYLKHGSEEEVRSLAEQCHRTCQSSPHRALPLLTFASCRSFGFSTSDIEILALVSGLKHVHSIS
jgi:hypothetical protein